MGKMLEAKVTVKGVRPLLFHHFGPDALPLEKQERTGVAGNDPEEWKKTVLANKEGQLYLLPTYAFSCMCNGAKYTKNNRSTYQAAVAATLQVLDDALLLDRFLPEGVPPEDPEAPVYLDIRSVRNPSTKGRNVRYRVAVPTGWTTSFTLLWDKTVVDRGVMETIARDAGRFAGFGDGRSIGYGRFEIESFEVKEIE